MKPLRWWNRNGIACAAWTRGLKQCCKRACYPNRCLSKDLLAAAQQHDRYTNESRVAKKLQDVLRVEPFNNKYARGWAFPSLPECRKLWEGRNGGRWTWHRDVADWGSE